MPNSGRHETLRHTALALIAPAMALFARIWMWADPRHVLLFPDPDYGYLFNSLLLLDGLTPWHIDHPGTPIQLIGALVMKLRFLLAGTSPTIHQDFFLDPVGYHQWIAHVLFSFILVTLWYTGFRLLRAGIGAALSVTIALLPLTYFDFLDYVGHTTPEGLLAALSVLLAPLLLEAAKGGLRAAVGAGALIGVLCTLKATAAPLAFCLFLLPGARNRIWGLCASAFFYLLITAPIWPEYPRLLQWYVSLGSKPGNYGHGAGAPTSPALLFANLRALLAGGQWNGNLAGLLLFPLLLALPFPRLSRWPVAISSLVLFLLILKHPATRYLLPFLALSALAIARASALPGWARAGLAALVLVPAPLLNAAPVSGRAHWHAQEAAAAAALEARLNSDDLRACTFTVVNELASPHYALFAGNFATAMHSYGDRLQAVHPRASFHFIQFRFFGDIATPDSWKRYIESAPCHVFVGRPERTEALIRGSFRTEPLLVATLGEAKNSAVYRVRDHASLLPLPPNPFMPAETPDTLLPLVSPAAD